VVLGCLKPAVHWGITANTNPPFSHISRIIPRIQPGGHSSRAFDHALTQG
jgi:hypothetical protein